MQLANANAGWSTQRTCSDPDFSVDWYAAHPRLVDIRGRRSACDRGMDSGLLRSYQHRSLIPATLTTTRNCCIMFPFLPRPSALLPGASFLKYVSANCIWVAISRLLIVWFPAFGVLQKNVDRITACSDRCLSVSLWWRFCVPARSLHHLEHGGAHNFWANPASDAETGAIWFYASDPFSKDWNTRIGMPGYEGEIAVSNDCVYL